jgi:hypothetical protein
LSDLLGLVLIRLPVVSNYDDAFPFSLCPSLSLFFYAVLLTRGAFTELPATFFHETYFVKVLQMNEHRDIVVGMATRCGLGVRVSNAGGARFSGPI